MITLISTPTACSCPSELQIEPDGKRYTINYCRVRYLHWDFHVRLSALTGPQVNDVRFQGERIAFELGLSEISVYYSADNPINRVTDYIDSGALLGRMVFLSVFLYFSPTLSLSLSLFLCLSLSVSLSLSASVYLWSSFC